MIVVRVFGGLGNQMFQYACGLALAHQWQDVLFLDTRPLSPHDTEHQGCDLSKIFTIRAPVIAPHKAEHLLGWQGQSWAQALVRRLPWLPQFLPSRTRVVRDPHYRYQSLQQQPSTRTTYLMGYWQSHLYFEAQSDIVRQHLAFPDISDNANAAIARTILACEHPVSLHVRRGDYVSNTKASQHHGTCDIEYYQRAITRLQQHVPSAHFFVFTDDPDWVRSQLLHQLPNKATHVAHNFGHRNYRDMQLMSLCKHHILANSSFSWWGAWLSSRESGVVIAPRHWFLSKLDCSTLCPPAWIRL